MRPLFPRESAWPPVKDPGRPTIPIHIFTVRLADGSLRRKVIPSRNYSDPTVRDRCLAKLAPGDRIVDRTWRPDFRYLDTRADTNDYAEHNACR